MLPGEADAAVHLDRPLAGGDSCLGRLRLRGGHGDRRLFVVHRDAPCGPVGQRAGKLGLDVGVGERVRDRLVGTDLLPELLAVRDVGDAELECLLRHADRFDGECCEQPQPHGLEVAVHRLPG